MLSVTILAAVTSMSPKLPGPAARVGSPVAGAWFVLHQPDLPAIYLCAIQLVQGTLHVRV